MGEFFLESNAVHDFDKVLDEHIEKYLRGQGRESGFLYRKVGHTSIVISMLKEAIQAAYLMENITRDDAEKAFMQLRLDPALLTTPRRFAV